MIDLDSCEKEQPEPQINIEKYYYEPFAKKTEKQELVIRGIFEIYSLF